MDEFRLIRLLRGSIYGKVILVQHVGNGKLYAVKMMSIAHMLAKRAVTGPKVKEDGASEIRILRALSGNHIVTPNISTIPTKQPQQQKQMVLPHHQQQQAQQQQQQQQQQEEDDVDDEDDVMIQAMQELQDRTESYHPSWPTQQRYPSTALSPLRHHHILTLHRDFIDHASNCRCLVFEYCPYGELYEQLQKSPKKALDLEKARDLFIQILYGVYYIHSKGIAHRDLSLENVLIDENKQCRIADFGLATDNGYICYGRVGKSFYMAPEVYAHGPPPSPNNTPSIIYDGGLLMPYNGLKADIWSLGIMLFMMVTGVPPLEIPCESDARFSVIQQKGIGALLKMWHMETRVNESLQHLLHFLLQVQPDQRPTIEQVLQHPWLNLDRTTATTSTTTTTCTTSGIPYETQVELVLQLPSEHNNHNSMMESQTKEELGVLKEEELEDKMEVDTVALSSTTTTSSSSLRRPLRKRMKLMIDRSAVHGNGTTDGTMSIETTSHPALRSHHNVEDEPCAIEGIVHASPGASDSRNSMETSTPVQAPNASPMVWPKVGVKAALRNLFFNWRSKNRNQNQEEEGDDDAESLESSGSMLEDDVENSQRSIERDHMDHHHQLTINSTLSGHRRRRQSSPSHYHHYQFYSQATSPQRTRNDSVSSGSSASSLNSTGSFGSENLRHGDKILCRFCLKWVPEVKCHRQVTLPSQVDTFSSGNHGPTTKMAMVGPIQSEPKTRRVCDDCFERIAKARAFEVSDHLRAPEVA